MVNAWLIFGIVVVLIISIIVIVIISKPPSPTSSPIPPNITTSYTAPTKPNASSPTKPPLLEELLPTSSSVAEITAIADGPLDFGTDYNISLKGLVTNLSQQAVTFNKGIFTLNLPGTYTITVEPTSGTFDPNSVSRYGRKIGLRQVSGVSPIGIPEYSQVKAENPNPTVSFTVANEKPTQYYINSGYPQPTQVLIIYDG